MCQPCSVIFFSIQATIGNVSEVKRPDDLDLNPPETNLAFPSDSKAEEEPLISPATPESTLEGQDWTNQQGVRFTNTENDSKLFFQLFTMICALKYFICLS